MFLRKVAVIGLDCVPDSLVFSDLRRELPSLRSLMEHGIWGTLLSTDPPITIPAWTTITTGLDPGELGLYGFRNRLDSRDYGLSVVNASHVHARRVWDYVEEQGGASVLIAIPQTYPPLPHRGVTVAGFPTPDFHTPYCYPHYAAERIVQLTGGDYANDIKSFRKKDKAVLLSDLYRAVESRFKVAADFISREPWTFFMMVETATDRLHHGFWADHDPSHDRHVPENPFRSAIPDFYRFLDANIGALLELVPDETTIMVVSDHGAGPLKGAVAINEWLMRNGYLRLSGPIHEETILSPDMVDWSRTTAWGEGGYYARIFFNVADRESQGIVSADEYRNFREELVGRLEHMTDESGRSINNRVLIPSEMYRSCHNVPPDLMVYFDDLNYRSSGMVGHDSVFLDATGDGMDEANHKPQGIFIMARMADVRTRNPRGSRTRPLTCLDITPTILFELGLDIPTALSGRPTVLHGVDLERETMGTSSCPVEMTPQSPVDQSQGFSPDEEEIIKQRLKDLGYM